MMPKTPRRLLIGIASLLTTGAVGFAFQARKGQREPTVERTPAGPVAGSKSLPRAEWKINDKVGVVLGVDRKRREVRISFGRADGAEVGMALRVSRPSGGPDSIPSDLGWLEVVSTGERESLTEVLPRKVEGEPELFEPGAEMRQGDQVVFATDPDAFRIFKLGMGDSPDAIKSLLQSHVKAARRRFVVSRAYYENGAITIDRYIDASRTLMEAEREVAANPAGKVAAVGSHLDRLTRLVEREEYKREFGSESPPNLAEARYEQAQAALLMARMRRGSESTRSGSPPPRGGRGSTIVGRAGEPARPLAGDRVGRVTRVDRDHGAIDLDFGRGRGAEVGMRLEIRSHRSIRLPSRDVARPDVTVQPEIEAPRSTDAVIVDSVDEQGCRAGEIYMFGGGRPNGRGASVVEIGDEAFLSSDDGALRVHGLGLAGGPESVHDLVRTRAAMARRWLQTARSYYEDSTISSNRFFDAMRALMTVEHEDAATRDGAVTALRDHLKSLKRFIDRERNIFLLDYDNVTKLADARCREIEAALMLARERRSERLGR
jgi:hypothetical protein